MQFNTVKRALLSATMLAVSAGAFHGPLRAQGIGQRQDEQRRALLQALLLAFGHATGAHHETLDAAVLGRVVGFGCVRRFV